MRTRYPFRIGATSYIIEAGLVENAIFLADKVDDMELILFDLPDGPSNLPDNHQRKELIEISGSKQLTYSVHLPLDLCLLPGNSSIEKAKKILYSIREIPISVVIAHIDGWVWRRQRITGYDPFLMRQWRSQAASAIAQVKEMIPGPTPLCIENLESFPAEAILSLAEETGVPLCIDIGHLYKYGQLDPLQFLSDNLHLAKILHLHGLKQKIDHQSITHFEEQQMKAILSILVNQNFTEIITLEVFGIDDFLSSIQFFHSSMER
ncbi:MAG: hypothetical protein K8R40_08910 [Anaerolineaceae bacterium]|nr:hypothetical protein [Anaerolineaceae bacterium]